MKGNSPAYVTLWRLKNFSILSQWRTQDFFQEVGPTVHLCWTYLEILMTCKKRQSAEEWSKIPPVRSANACSWTCWSAKKIKALLKLVNVVHVLNIVMLRNWLIGGKDNSSDESIHNLLKKRRWIFFQNMQGRWLMDSSTVQWWIQDFADWWMKLMTLRGGSMTHWNREIHSCGWTSLFSTRHARLRQLI